MSELFQAALESHRAGRLEQAEVLYQHILSESPRNADALHLLGLVAHQRGQPARAIPLMEQAVALNPTAAIYHVNLAEAQRVAGNPAQAEAHARQALGLEPASAEAYNNLGLALHHQGRDDEAIAAYERAIELKPFFPRPYVNLAETLRQLDRPREALAFLNEGLRLIPNAPDLHSHLSRVLLDMGELDEAVAHCQEALRLQPNSAEALCHQGDVLRALGRPADARTCYQRAMALQPRLAAPYQSLGQMSLAEGQVTAALRWLRQALPFDPQSATLHADLAAALYENEQVDEAIAEYRQAVRFRPGKPDLHNNLGYLLQDQGNSTAAVAAYRQAIQLRPDYADSHVNLGLVLTEMGQLPEAQAAFREALGINPTHPEALAALALSLRDQLPEADQAAAQAALADETIPPRRQAVLCYGLAHFYDARKNFARVAELIQQANHTFLAEDRQRGRAYDPAEHRAYVDQIIAAYGPAHFERVRGWGIDSDLPVFIVGLPRSGTSLAEQILASHPRMFGAGGLALARDCYRAIPGLVGKDSPGIECIGQLTPAVVQQLAHQYLDPIRSLHPTAPRIVDKMPDNYLMLGLIVTLLPRARIIHLRRDPRDVGLSCWMTYFRHIRWSFDLDHIGSRIRDYLRLIAHWRRVLPVPLLEIDYEDLVADTEAVARQMVQWCGLEWDPACLAFHQTPRVVRTASMVQVRQPVYRRSVGRWQKYEMFLGTLLRYLPPALEG